MKIKGDIVFIDDDEDDKFLYKTMFKELGFKNPVVFFENANDAYSYFINPASNPFLVLSDISMPLINGIEMRQQLLNNPYTKKKCFPFIFITTGISPYDMDKVFGLSIQGCFIKETDYDKQKLSFKKIIEYWLDCYTLPV